jgi:hypothetical protein
MKHTTIFAIAVLSLLFIAVSPARGQFRRLPQPPAAPQPPTPPSPRQFTLRVATSGAGSVGGAVPIACPGVCNASYIENTRLWLVPTPGPDSIFAGWSGSCSGTAPCVLTMNQDHSVTANFIRPQLTVSLEGSGTGRVSSNPPGISDCGTDCDEAYPANWGITLTAHNGTGVFAGWRGCTIVKDDCYVLMNENKNVVASFERPLLRVTTDGGRVTSNVAGIDCGDDCEQRYDNGMRVLLSATPDAGMSFARWEGDCESGPRFDTCIVSMDKPERKVWAVFIASSRTGYARTTSPGNSIGPRLPTGTSTIIGPPKGTTTGEQMLGSAYKECKGDNSAFTLSYMKSDGTVTSTAHRFRLDTRQKITFRWEADWYQCQNFTWDVTGLKWYIKRQGSTDIGIELSTVREQTLWLDKGDWEINLAETITGPGRYYVLIP